MPQNIQERRKLYKIISKTEMTGLSNAWHVRVTVEQC